ncbi:hypothetical protein D3C73_963260 [compost metagenome]
MVTHSVHQVGFTQADATIKEEWVVTVLGVVCHLPGSGARQLVGFTFNEILEGKGAVQVTGVLERTFDLHGTLLGAHRCLLRTGSGHRVEAVTGRFFLGDFSHFLRRTLGRHGGRCRRRTDGCLSSLGLGSRSSQGSVWRGTGCRTAFAAY